MLDMENLEKWEDAHQVKPCIFVASLYVCICTPYPTTVQTFLNVCVVKYFIECAYMKLCVKGNVGVTTPHITFSLES